MDVDVTKAVKLLLQARRTGVQVKPPFAIPDRAAVYAIQDGVAKATGAVAGWKVAARRPPIPTLRRCWPAHWSSRRQSSTARRCT